MKDNTFNFDIAVVGAGHAGCEAALAAARLGMKTIVLTINLDSIDELYNNVLHSIIGEDILLSYANNVLFSPNLVIFEAKALPIR